MKNSWLLLILVHFGLICFGQSERKLIREGNEYFYKNDNKKAEETYQKALEKNKNSYEAEFNLADAKYKQNNYDEAIKHFEGLTAKTKEKEDLSKVYHNLGNSFLKKKEFEKSISAYKNALKNNPSDNDTRYNLAYAQKMLQQQQQQQKNDQNKDNKNKDQKDKDKQDQQKQNEDKNKKDDKDQKQNDQQSQDKQDKKDQQKEPQPDNMSKEDAKRLLDALNNQEKNIQDKLKKQKGKAFQVQIEKDW